MKELFNFLKKQSLLHSIDEIPIHDEQYNIVGYSVITRSVSGKPLSQGTASDKDIAKRIAIAELSERTFVRLISQNQETKEKFLLSQYPTTCGFAAGFDRKKTKGRAICEAVERWIWSKWIDDHMHIDQYIVPNQIDDLSNHLMKPFLDSKFFMKSLVVHNNNYLYQLYCHIFIGFTESGAFAGSRVSSVPDSGWQHAIIEANRNFQNSIFFSTNSFDWQQKNMIAIRGQFFAQNKSIALSQILSPKKQFLCTPSILLIKELQTPVENIFLFRCLMKDFVPWNSGPIERFVY